MEIVQRRLCIGKKVTHLVEADSCAACCFVVENSLPPACCCQSNGIQPAHVAHANKANSKRLHAGWHDRLCFCCSHDAMRLAILSIRPLWRELKRKLCFKPSLSLQDAKCSTRSRVCRGECPQIKCSSLLRCRKKFGEEEKSLGRFERREEI